MRSVVDNAANLAYFVVTTFSFCCDSIFKTAMDNNAGAFAAASVSLTDEAVSGTDETASVVTNIAKVASGEISSITLSGDAEFKTVMAANAAAFDAGGVSLTD